MLEGNVEPTDDMPDVSRRSRGANKRSGARFAAFRQFLLDTYGHDRLAHGSGVLDVAGGQGSLAWELLNYDHIPVTVVGLSCDRILYFISIPEFLATFSPPSPCLTG